MKRIIFLFSLLLMLGVSIQTIASETSDKPCIATIYQSVNQDLVYDCSYWKITPVNNPYVSYEVANGYVIKIKASQSSLLDMKLRNKEYFDLPVTVNHPSTFEAYIRIIFID